MNIEHYLYIAAILFGLMAIAMVSYDYYYKKAPDWLTVPCIFIFSMLTSGMVTAAYLKFS